MNIDDYLKKIKCDDCRNGPLTVERMEKVRNGHVKTFPFENIDMHTGKHIEMSLEIAYDNLMNKSRGGYCIHNNIVLAWALQQIGYTVFLVECFVYSEYFQEYKEGPVHVAIVVNLNDELYYVDGGTIRFLPPSIQISLGKIQKYLYGSFIFERENDFMVLKRGKKLPANVDDSNVKLERQIYFKLEPKTVDYFKHMNDYVQTKMHPVIFYRTIFLKHFPNKIVFLMGWKYTVVEFSDVEGEVRQDRILQSGEEAREIIRNVFGLAVDDSFEPVDKIPNY